MWKSKEISSPFTRWFTADGFFVAEPFQKWLSEEVEMIATASKRQTKQSIEGASENDSVPLEEAKPTIVKAEQTPTKRPKKAKK